MAKILLTGATGYIGRAVAEHLVKSGDQVIALVRSKPTEALPCPFFIPSDWSNLALMAKAMEGCDAVIHCAGLAHGKDGDMAYTNIHLVDLMAMAAETADVKRFVFVSTAAVFGAAGTHKPTDMPTPKNTYGESKWKAEQGLLKTKLTFSIVRAPMVLGTATPGRGETLRRFAKYPLPFGTLSAERSYVTLDDMAQLLADEAHRTDNKSSLIHAASGVMTATGLIRAMASLDGYTVTLFPCPPIVLKWLGAISPRLGAMTSSLVETHILHAGRVDLD